MPSNPVEEQPKWITHRCRIPDTEGKPCGFFKKYRVLPKDVKTLPTERNEFEQLVGRRLGATYNDWFTTHLQKAHPNEWSNIQDAVSNAARYVMVKRIQPLMDSSRE
jgi:hypothetical protein